MAIRKKVLFLPSWYPNRTAPSLGNFIQRHAAAVSPFHDIAVLYAAADPSLESKYEVELTEQNGVQEVIVYYRKVTTPLPIVSHFLKRMRLYGAYNRGYNLVKQEFGQPDIVHVHVIWRAILFALQLHRQHKTPYVISEHWSGYMKEDGSYKNGFNYRSAVTKAGVKHASAVIAVSERMKEAMLGHALFANYHVIPNVVDTELFRPSQKPAGEKIRMIHVSTVNDREKNISGMLRVVKKLSEKRQDFILEIVGDSPERTAFERLATGLGIMDKHVVFSGYRTIEQVAERMRASHFFLMFSNYEGLPCVILEAMASGLPVVATRTGGIPQVISPERGILVNVGDKEALLAALTRMLDEYKNYNSESLRNYTIDNFSYDRVGRQIAAVYEKVLA